MWTSKGDLGGIGGSSQLSDNHRLRAIAQGCFALNYHSNNSGGHSRHIFTSIYSVTDSCSAEWQCFSCAGHKLTYLLTPSLACEWKFELRYIRVFRVSESTWLINHYVHAIQNCWNWKQERNGHDKRDKFSGDSGKQQALQLGWPWRLAADCPRGGYLPATGNARYHTGNRRIRWITSCKFQRIGSTTKI